VSEQILIDKIQFARGLDSGENLKELVRDLKASGQKVPILVLSDFTLVDGLRRVMALNTLGAKEVDAIVASTFDECIEALYLAHSGQSPVQRPRRSWELYTQLKPLIDERRTRLTRERQVGIPRKDRPPSTHPLSRTLLDYAIGKGWDKIVQVYRIAEEAEPTSWRRAVVRDLEDGKITVGTAYRRILGRYPLTGNIHTVKDQSRLVSNAARQLTGLMLTLDKLAWPIVIPSEDRQPAIAELKKNRGKLARIIHLLEEAESND
jgi:hypothetical protein